MLKFQRKKREFNLVSVLSEIQALLQKSENSDWATQTPEQINALLSAQIENLNQGRKVDKEELALLFAPTGDIQETAMANNWSEKYLSLSSKLDVLMEKS